MDIVQFYRIFIPALEKALEADNLKGRGYGPEFYVDDQYILQIAYYLDHDQDLFMEKVGYFFDAINHNFPGIQGVDINVYRENLLQEISRIKKDII